MVRISEIANELGSSSNVILKKAIELGLKVKHHSDTVSPVDAAAIYEYITYGIKPLALKEQEEKMDKLDDYIKELDRAMPQFELALKEQEEKIDKLDDCIKELYMAMPQFEVDDRLNECIKILSDLDEALDEFKNFDKMDYKIDEPFEDLWIGELEDGELKKALQKLLSHPELAEMSKMVLNYIEISLDRLDEILVKSKSYWSCSNYDQSFVRELRYARYIIFALIGWSQYSKPDTMGDRAYERDQKRRQNIVSDFLSDKEIEI